MSNNSTSSSTSIGFTGLLTLAFIILKLMKFIDWSWWWVLSPLWINVGITIGIAVIMFVIAIIRKDI